MSDGIITMEHGMKYYQSIPNTAEPLLADTLVDIAKYRAHRQPTQIAYAFMNNGLDVSDSLTYAELDRRAGSIAGELIKPGAEGRPTSALLLFSPGLDFIVAFWACLYAGVIAIPAYPILNIKDMKRLVRIIHDSGARTILTSSEKRDAIELWFGQHDIENLHYITVNTVTDSEQEVFFRPPMTDLAFLQYTSGSTGNPKGVMVSHENLLHNLHQIYSRFEHDKNSVGVIWLPPYHDMGLIGGILQPLYGGFPVYLMSPFTFIKRPTRWLEAISRYGATTSGGPNFAYQLCVKHARKLKEKLDLSKWKIAFCGAEPIRQSTFDQFNREFVGYGWNSSAFYPCYGLAESTLMVSGGQSNEPPRQVAANPEALSKNIVQPDSTDSSCVIIGNGTGADAEIAIVSPDNLLVLGDGQVGEIWVRSESVARGYWKNTALTSEIFQAYTQCGRGPFLRTGDLGALLNHELFVTGRMKELIIINGRNYYPTDLETCVQETCDEANPGGGAAFSISREQEDLLVLVQELKREKLNDAILSDVSASIAAAVYDEFGLTVHDVLLLAPGTIPKTSSGKIKRREIKWMYQNGGIETLASRESWSEVNLSTPAITDRSPTETDNSSRKINIA